MSKTAHIIFSIILIFTGCNRNLSDEPLKLSENHITCRNVGGEFCIEVFGQEQWSVEYDAEWINIRSTNEYAIISIDRNNGIARNACVIFRGGQSSEILNIEQLCSDEFSIDPQTLNPGWKGCGFTARVTCYGNWETECEEDWISIDPEEGKGPEEIKITINQNDGYTERYANINIDFDGQSETITICQDASPMIELEKTEIDTNGDGGTFHIQYMCNTEIDITAENDWIRLIKNTKDKKLVSFEVLRNLGEAREGQIKLISAKDSEYFKVLTIKQGKKIDHPTISFEEGTYLNISTKDSFKLNPIFTDMSDHSILWTSSAPEIAEVGKNGTITINSGGICTINARNEHHNTSASITLDIKLLAESMHIFLDDQDIQENPIAVRYVGEKLTIKVNIYPNDAYDDDLICLSSDTDVASIDGRKIKCLSSGQTTISIESPYQGISKHFTLIILE